VPGVKSSRSIAGTLSGAVKADVTPPIQDRTAVGTLTAIDPDSGDTQAWSIVGGSAAHAPDYHFAIDRFTVTRTGANAFTFDDQFDGSDPAPPDGPDFFGNLLPYNVTGTFTESGGRAVMDGATAVEVGNFVNGGALDTTFGHFATLRTPLGASGQGLRANSDFTVAGVFDLVLPDETRELFGLRLSDRIVGGSGTPPDQPGDDVIELGVNRTADGQVNVVLREIDFAGGQSSILEQVALSAGSADQIRLVLTHDDANSGVVHAAFQLGQGGVFAAPVNLSATGSIFNGEDWTRAQILSRAPEQSDTVKQGTYGTLTLTQVGAWTYALDNSDPDTLALPAGVHDTDAFTVKVDDGNGGFDTKTITIDVAGIGEPLEQTLTINVLTANGMDFSVEDPIDQIGSGGPVLPGSTPTSFTIVNAAADRRFEFQGFGLQYDEGIVVGGTLTGFHEFVHSTNAPLADFFGVTLPAAAFHSAARAKSLGDDAPFEALQAGLAFDFHGNAGVDVFGDNGRNDTFTGGGGDDKFHGGAGIDRSAYTDATGPITVDMLAGTVTGNGVGTDTLTSIEHIRGSSFADTYVATGYAGASAVGSLLATFNEFEGMEGDDVITGNGGTALSYLNATAAVAVDLIDGTAVGDASVGNDTFTGVAIVRGSSFGDTLLGSNNAIENFVGGAGDDFINGRSGFDRVFYWSRVDDHVTGGITINLADGKVFGDASIGTDTLRSIEGARGTNFVDSYDATGFGQAGALNVGSNGTFNEFEGMGGDDLITGNGNTRIAYANAAAGVTVDLAAGTASGDASVGDDNITGGVNSIVGSNFSDHLFGSNNAAFTSEIFDGRGGDDIFDGRGGFDQAAYDLLTTAGIAVDMAAGKVTGDAGVGTDTLISIESVRGTNFADTYVATGFAGASTDTGLPATFNEFEGGGGNDVITGNGETRITYQNATGGVTVDLFAGTASGNGSVGFDTFTEVNRVRGSNFNDLIFGNAGNNILDGLGGSDTVSYANAAAGVTVSLGLQGNGQNTFGAGIDTLTNFENLGGSNHNDVLTGNGGNNILEGAGGNDIITGNGGIDTASYEHAGAGVTVSLALQGVAQDTVGAGTDTLSGIANLRGGGNDDILTGQEHDNVIEGGGGNDVLDGGASNSGEIFGDWVTYEHAAAGVTVDLGLQGSAQNTFGAGTDTLTNFENLVGSNFGDVLTGNSGNNVLTGLGGTDTFVFKFGSGADTLTDFNVNADVIDLVDYGFDNFDDFLATNPFSDTAISLPGGSSIALASVNPNNLNSSHFVFTFGV
jgi:VCBS repeat-containing protein